MKATTWGAIIIIFGLAGLVLISLFGDITTTNQQNYIEMKNNVEAAIFDSVDYASYRTGFYVCTALTTISQKSEYKIVIPDNYNPSIDKNCTLVEGEYKINKEVFVESLLRRFSEITEKRKSYRVTIQEVVEYPVKVSVRIESFDNYTLVTTNEFNEGDFKILNQIDSILENID